MPFIINDGFTLDGKAEIVGLPSISFTYRPATHEAVQAYLAAPKKTPADSLKAICAVLLKHVKTWDVVVDEAGAASAAINEAMLAAIPDRLLLRMLNIVCGYDPAADEKN